MFLTILALILAIIGYIGDNFWLISSGIFCAVLGVRKTVLSFDRGGAIASFAVLFGALFLSWISYPDDTDDTTPEPKRVEQRFTRNPPSPQRPAPEPVIRTPEVHEERPEEKMMVESPPPQPEPEKTPPASGSPIVYFGNPDRGSPRVIPDTPEYNQKLQRDNCADHPDKIEIFEITEVALGKTFGKDTINELDFKICRGSKAVEVPHLPEIEPDIYLVRSAYLGQYKETAKISDFVEVSKIDGKTFLSPKNEVMEEANIDFVFVLAESESRLATKKIHVKPVKKPAQKDIYKWVAQLGGHWTSDKDIIDLPCATKDVHLRLKNDLVVLKICHSDEVRIVKWPMEARKGIALGHGKEMLSIPNRYVEASLVSNGYIIENTDGLLKSEIGYVILLVYTF